MHILGAIAEFERGCIVERVRAGLARAKAQGKRLGRKGYDLADARFEEVAGLSVRDAYDGARGQPLGRASVAAVTKTPLDGAEIRGELLSDFDGRAVTCGVTPTGGFVTRHAAANFGGSRQSPGPIEHGDSHKSLPPR
jgi:hypothetical protein